MVQCPDCESKDRITIAGKVFCANCGTPWVESPKSATTPASNKASTDPMQTTSSAVPHQPNPTTPQPVASKPTKPVLAQSPLTDNPNAPHLPKNAPPPQIKIRSLSDKKQTSTAISQTSNISKFHLPKTDLTPADKAAVSAPNPHPSPAPSPISELPSDTYNPPAPTIVTPKPLTPTIPSFVAQPPAEQDSAVEIPDLKDHEQAVLSDKQFSDLESIKANDSSPNTDNPAPAARSLASGPSVLQTPSLPANSQPIVSSTTSPPPPTSIPVAVSPPPVAAAPTAKPLIAPLTPPIPSPPAEAATAPVQTLPTAQNQTPIAPSISTPPPAPRPQTPTTPPTPSTQRLQDMLAPTPPPQTTQPPTPAMHNDRLVIKPTTAPPTMKLPKSGLDGVTMSREQALKLALGDSEEPTTSVGSNYKPLKIAIVVVIVLLIGGYIWQINYPNLALKIASARAGISASSPHYVPNGWSVTRNIISSQNKLEYSLKSTDNKEIHISQVKSDWDSAALLEDYVVSEAANVETVQAQGLTIYLYGDSRASWVNHGSWFRLDGSGSGLSQQELIKIATSL